MTSDASLPPGTRPGPVHLEVADLARSLAWYGQVLGLDRLDRLDPGERPSEAILGVEADSTPLVRLREHPGAAPVPPRGRLGLFHFAILLPERAQLGRFVRHLGEIGERAGASDHLVSEALYLQDPDGLGVEVYADRPRDQWRFRGDELVMATEPLDLDDLVQAGAGDPWRSIPAGTRMGHIHLHVGDLERAESFYHELLGFDRTVWSYPGALFLSAGGYHHHLGVNTWARGAPVAKEGEARLIEWELRVPDADAAAGALDRLEHGGHEVRRGADGGTVADPWGTRVQIRTG